MMYRDPEIVAKLYPAREIVTRLNQVVKVKEWDMDMDGISSELRLRKNGSPVGYALTELVESLFLSALDLLPEGYFIEAQDGDFVIIRLTEEEVAAQRAAEEAFAAEECKDLKGEEIPYFFRIEAAAKVSFDAAGNPVPFYGVHTVWFGERSTAEDKAERFARKPAHIAKECCIDPQLVTPISLEEYKAAGYSVEG